LEDIDKYWRINIDRAIPFFFESATKREVDAKRRRRGTTSKPKRKKKRSRISGRATLPPDRVNYGTISSGRYISLRLRTEPLLPATVRSILALVSSLPADSLLAWEGRGGGRKRTCLSSLRGKTLARARAFARTRKLRKGTGRLVNYRRNSSLCLVRVWFLFFFFSASRCFSTQFCTTHSSVHGYFSRIPLENRPCTRKTKRPEIRDILELKNSRS